MPRKKPRPAARKQKAKLEKKIAAKSERKRSAWPVTPRPSPMMGAGLAFAAASMLTKADQT